MMILILWVVVLGGRRQAIGHAWSMVVFVLGLGIGIGIGVGGVWTIIWYDIDMMREFGNLAMFYTACYVFRIAEPNN